MKFHSKLASFLTLAFAAIASIAFLACNDTPSASTGDDNATPLKQVTPYDPPMVLIADDVGKWMEDNLASKSGEKKLIDISDMYLSSNEKESLSLSSTIDADGKVEYFSNGNKISAEEYKAKRIEYDRQRTDGGKRNLTVPGEITSESTRHWTVSVTAEELSEFIKNNDNIAIEFYVEYTEDV